MKIQEEKRNVSGGRLPLASSPPSAGIPLPPLLRGLGEKMQPLAARPLKNPRILIYYIMVASLAVSVASISASAEQDQIDENALFSDTSSITSSKDYVDTQKTRSAIEKPSVGFSGTVTSAAVGDMHRDCFTDKPRLSSTDFSSSIIGDLTLDARLTQGFKAFGTAEINYAPIVAGSGSDTLQLGVPELFVDANVNRLVYIRTGKQVLQWGRCYLWNPTDLVNVEKKSFITKLTAREGTFGTKLHVPFGTVANLYGFLGTNTATRIDSVYGAAKAEALFGNTEMALSIWGKRGFAAVYGYDLSSRLWGIDIAAEIGLYQQFNLKKIDLSGPLAVTVEKHDWVPRVALDLGRSFDVSGVPDRLTINLEGYYNQVGSTDSHISLPVVPAPGQGTNANMGPQAQQALLGYLVSSGVYEANSFSRWYAAMFGTFAKFIIPDMTFSLNAIGNLNEQCAIISAGLGYRNLSDFSLGFNLNGFVGPANTEYTLQNQGLQVQVTAGVAF
jgi:hypothetical protein